MKRMRRLWRRNNRTKYYNKPFPYFKKAVEYEIIKKIKKKIRNLNMSLYSAFEFYFIFLHFIPILGITRMNLVFRLSLET